MVPGDDPPFWSVPRRLSHPTAVPDSFLALSTTSHTVYLGIHLIPPPLAPHGESPALRTSVPFPSIAHNVPRHNFHLLPLCLQSLVRLLYVFRELHQMGTDSIYDFFTAAIILYFLASVTRQPAMDISREPMDTSGDARNLFPSIPEIYFLCCTMMGLDESHSTRRKKYEPVVALEVGTW